MQTCKTVLFSYELYSIKVSIGINSSTVAPQKMQSKTEARNQYALPPWGNAIPEGPLGDFF